MASAGIEFADVSENKLTTVCQEYTAKFGGPSHDLERREPPPRRGQ